MEQGNDSSILAPVRKISAELTGDDALQADVLITSLQLSGSKLAKDKALVSLALKALSKAVEDCGRETGKRFPTEADVLDFIKGSQR
ncbi:MAG: hypothetical protein K0U21_08595 [Proteobacteria bacterium]|nr:hypothetical protein [Pseudomonadota bacterium]